MRLYRAMDINETELNSNQRAFINGKLNVDINLINEMYSHIIRSSNSSYAQERKIIFSFTDDINKAIEILNEYPNYYNRIGYVDIYFLGINDNGSIKWVWPVYCIEDWVKAEYYLKKNDDLELTYQNLNFEKESEVKKLANTLIPSQNGACSYAKKANEYHIICQSLLPKILDVEQIEEEKRKENQILDFPILDQYFYDKIGLKILKDLNDVDATDNRKEEVRKLTLEHMTKKTNCNS